MSETEFYSLDYLGERQLLGELIIFGINLIYQHYQHPELI